MKRYKALFEGRSEPTVLTSGNLDFAIAITEKIANDIFETICNSLEAEPDAETMKLLENAYSKILHEKKLK